MNRDDLLKPKHRAAGLHLEEYEDRIWLTCGDEGLGIWRKNTFITFILAEADRWIKANHAKRQDWGTSRTRGKAATR